MGGYVIWPEGLPEKARFTATQFGRQWLLLGHGLIWGLQGRRMCECRPVKNTEVPVIVARRCERSFWR